MARPSPTKISLRPGDALLSHWPMSVPPPGLYRADVMLDDNIAWRGYFRVKE